MTVSSAWIMKSILSWDGDSGEEEHGRTSSCLWVMLKMWISVRMLTTVHTVWRHWTMPMSWHGAGELGSHDGWEAALIQSYSTVQCITVQHSYSTAQVRWGWQWWHDGWEAALIQTHYTLYTRLGAWGHIWDLYYNGSRNKEIDFISVPF